MPFRGLGGGRVTGFAFVDAVDVVGVALKDAELVEVVLEVGDDGRRAVLEQELNQVESLNGDRTTFKIFFQLLLFFSFSQMNSLIRCHFSLGRVTCTSCRPHWRFRAVGLWMLASSLPKPLPPVFRRGRLLRFWPCCLNTCLQLVGSVLELLKYRH